MKNITFLLTALLLCISSCKVRFKHEWKEGSRPKFDVGGLPGKFDINATAKTGVDKQMQDLINGKKEPEAKDSKFLKRLNEEFTAIEEFFRQHGLHKEFNKPDFDPKSNEGVMALNNILQCKLVMSSVLHLNQERVPDESNLQTYVMTAFPSVVYDLEGIADYWGLESKKIISEYNSKNKTHVLIKELEKTAVVVSKEQSISASRTLHQMIVAQSDPSYLIIQSYALEQNLEKTYYILGSYNQKADHYDAIQLYCSRAGEVKGEEND